MFWYDGTKIWRHDVIQAALEQAEKKVVFETRWIFSGCPRARREESSIRNKLPPSGCNEVLRQHRVDWGKIYSEGCSTIFWGKFLILKPIPSFSLGNFVLFYWFFVVVSIRPYKKTIGNSVAVGQFRPSGRRTKSIWIFAIFSFVGWYFSISVMIWMKGR